MADPVQIRVKEKRLAEALRANLKRRKQRGQENAAANDATPKGASQHPTASAGKSE